MWRTRFGRGYEPAAIQTIERINLPDILMVTFAGTTNLSKLDN